MQFEVLTCRLTPSPTLVCMCVCARAIVRACRGACACACVRVCLSCVCMCTRARACTYQEGSAGGQKWVAPPWLLLLVPRGLTSCALVNEWSAGGQTAVNAGRPLVVKQGERWWSNGGDFLMLVVLLGKTPVDRQLTLFDHCDPTVTNCVSNVVERWSNLTTLLPPTWI